MRKRSACEKEISVALAGNPNSGKTTMYNALTGKNERVGKSRVKNVAQARHIAIYLVRTITEMSLPNIGKLFNRDHSTIISSIDTIEKKISSSPAIEIEINELIKEIKE